MHRACSLAPLIISTALGAGCVDLVAEPVAPAADPAAADCALPDDYRILDSGHIVDGELIVGTVAELEADCDAGRPFRGAAPRGTPRGIGLTAAAARWPNARVPYAIDPALPDQDRIAAAIAEWQAKTPLRFVSRTAADADYLYFTNGNECASSVGRRGGRQDIVLSSGKQATRIVASSISDTDTVFTWFDDGMAAAGDSMRLDASRVQYPYSLPPGYSISQIRGIGIAKSNDRVYVWYGDGMVSAGTTADLDAHAAPAPYSLPPGKTAAQIVEIDISRSDRVYTWFSDGTVSIGTTTDLDAYQAPAPFAPAAGEAIDQLRGIGIAGSSDRVFAWYADRRASIGTSADLDAHAPLYSFAPPAHCPVPAVIHEIGHAIGLQHEQTRCDRDSHIRIFWDNIASGAGYNYERNCSSGNQDLGAYNLASIMHYGSLALSATGSPTLLGLVSPGLAVPASAVADTSIASSGHVYTWWTDGKVTSGSSEDLELHRARYRYRLPTGYAPADIVGIGIARSTDRVYAFYRDGRRSIGTTEDLAAHAAPASYALPPGYTPADIVALDMASTDRVYTWYGNGRFSIGTSTDLDAHAAPAPYALAGGRAPSAALGIAIAPNDWVYAWYTNGQASAGTSAALDSRRAAYAFRQRLHAFDSSNVLSPGDIAAVDALY